MADEPPDGEPLGRTFTVVLLALIALPLGLRLPLLKVRGFNPDELEHLQASWLVAAGRVPYRDFFEHHTPALYYLLRPLFVAFDVGGSVTDAWDAILWARGTMVAFTALALGLVFWFGRRWRGVATGGFAALLLANGAIFLGKTLEVRPDVPALACLAGALAASLVAAAGPAPRAGWGLPCLAGALLSLAVLFTQKALFVLPGFLLAMVWWLRRSPGGRRWVGGAAGLAGFAVPLALTAAFFWWQASMGPFVELNFLLNSRWPYRLSPGPLGRELLRQEWLVALLAAVGAARYAARRPAGNDLTTAGYLLAGGCLASVVIGAFFIPVAQRQYALLALPSLALLAGAGFADLAHGLRRWRWAPPLLLALVAAASTLPAALRLRESFGRTNGGTLANIRYVLRNVSASETVLDGFSGEGVFRPNAYYYFFLHDEIRRIAHPDELMSGLRRGEIAPKLVLFDRHLQEWSPDLAAFLRANYADIGQPPIRVRLYDNGTGRWDEAGWRRLAGPAGAPLAEPHVFIGDGWRRVEMEGATAFRATRGRQAALTLPVRDVAEVTLVARARAEPPGQAVEVELVVNGAPSGSARVEAHWHEATWTVAAGSLRRGLNEIVFLPGAAIAVEAVRLGRR
jgi:hypothetical protein